MDISVALILLISLLGVSTILGFLLKRNQLKVKPSTLDSLIVTKESLGLPSDYPFGNNVTIVQFSTQFCSKCPGTARLLAAESNRHKGVKHIEVDLTHQIEIAKEFNVLQTPTTLILDSSGRLKSRIVGAPTVDVVRSQLHDILIDEEIH